MHDWYQKILDEFHKERNTEAFYKTQGFKKLWNYYLAVVESDKFQETVKRLRGKYDLPQNGILLPETGSHTVPHPAWKHHSNRKLYRELQSETREISLNYGLLPKDWAEVIESYIFHDISLICPEPNSRNLCFVSDGKTKKDSLGRDLTSEDVTIYPATLHISPYASKRDVLDYIERIYKTGIEPLQKLYRNPDVKIGSFRTGKKINQRRNKFIEEQADLPRKQLLRLVREQFGKEAVKNLDEGSIGKVISYKKKRRQKV